MRAHPLPEARVYAELMLEELRKVIPSFLSGSTGPTGAGRGADYLAATRRRDGRARRAPLRRPEPQRGGRRVGAPPRSTLPTSTPTARTRSSPPSCYPYRRSPESEVLDRVRRLGAEESAAILAAYVGERPNRRHRPGRAFERTDYRFDVVTDYGAFRDLQRHRMLTIEWQPLGAALGYDVPEVVAEAGLAAATSASLERSRELYETLGADLPAPGRLRRRPRLPDPLLDADERPRGDAPARAAQHGPRATPATAGSPRRCTARSPSTPATGARRGHVARRLQRRGLGRLESERRAEERRPRHAERSRRPGGRRRSCGE